MKTCIGPLATIVTLAVSISAQISHADSAAHVNNVRAAFVSECRSEGNRIEEFPTKTITTNNAVRADLVTICIDEGRNRALLFFRASAMNKASYRTAKQAPWFGLTFQDSSGNDLWSKKNLVVATVQECGQYEAHISKLPQQFEAGKIDNVVLHMSGANRVSGSCSGGILPRWTIRDVENAIDDFKNLQKRWED